MGLNKEKTEKLLVVTLLFILLFVLSIVSFLGYTKILLFLIILLILSIILFIIELYLRIQHHLDNISKESIIFNQDIKKRLENSEKKISLNQENNFLNQKELIQEIKETNLLQKEIGLLTQKNSEIIEEINLNKKEILRFILQKEIEKQEPKKEDVTVIIGIRDRYDFRIINALKSIRNQKYPKELIQIILVDYGSKKSLIPKYNSICKKFSVKYLRISDAKEWNRSRCINLGINNSTTKYILISDVDVIFKDNYINEAVKKIKENKYSVIFSKMKFMREDRIIKDFKQEDYGSLLNETELGHPYNDPDMIFWQGMSIIFGLRKLFLLIGGYDEQFRLWGSEDSNIIKRFSNCGVNIIDISDKSSYIHQWHEKYEGINKVKDFKKTIKSNKEYRDKNKSLFKDYLKENVSSKK